MSSRERPASVLAVREEDVEGTVQSYSVTPRGELNGRFVHRPVRSTNHVVQATPDSPAYATEAERLDSRDGIQYKSEVERLQKERAKILSRHEKIRENKARVEAYAVEREARTGMDAVAELRQKALSKQKIKYLKAVAVSHEQQRPRRLAQALTSKGMM